MKSKGVKKSNLASPVPFSSPYASDPAKVLPDEVLMAWSHESMGDDVEESSDPAFRL